MKLLNKVKISLLISIFVIGLLSIKAFAVTGTITEITVNLREKPSTDSKKIMYVTQDDVVEVLEKDGEWYKIKAKGKTGYVFGEYIKVDDSKLTTTKAETVETTVKEDTQTNNEKEELTETQEEVNNTNLIIKNKTQIRIIPNISSSVIYTASKNMQIDIIDQINNWTYISIDGILGWVRTDKIVEENEVLPDEKEEVENTEKKDEESTEKTTIAYIKYDTVNLREKASTSAKVLAKLELNDEVTVLEKVNSTWSKVKVDGKTGYISTELLSDKIQEVKEETKTENNTTTSRDGEETTRKETSTKTEEVEKVEEATKKEETTTNKVTTTVTNTATNKEETSSSKVSGTDIAEYAKTFVGCKYVYGGTSPSGFDCSGLTYYVYKHFGYKISRSSKAQAKNGTEVAKSDLQPGDLIIYKNQSLTAIGHVGIYIGNNKMVHASEPGVGVIITDIDSKAHKYDKRYVTARRII